MANFVLIENNEIVEYHDLLPKTWKNVSGLSLAKDDDEFLNSLGWYKVIKVELYPIEGMQYIDGYSYTFEDNIVYETPIIKNSIIPTPEPEKTPEELFEIALDELRTKRDNLLMESDWTQLADIQSTYSEIWKTNWATYRQQLRDLPNQCVSGELNIYSFEWPIKPQSANIVVSEENVNVEPEAQEPIIENPNAGEP
jgi:hypothetical protein